MMNQPNRRDNNNRRREVRRIPEEKEFQEVVLQIKRVSKKTKGGNQIGFTALMVIGDGKGKMGIGLGKAKDVATAIRKGIVQAKKRLITVPLKGETIPYPVKIKKDAAIVLLKPAREGTGIIAGGVIRPMALVTGIKDLVAKSLGSPNKMANVYATLEAFKRLDNLITKQSK